MAPAREQRPFLGVLLWWWPPCFSPPWTPPQNTLTMRYNVPMVMAIRYMVHCLLMILVLAPSQGAATGGDQAVGPGCCRALSLVAASLFFGLTLQRMPIAESTALIFLAPILVVLIAGRCSKRRSALSLARRRVWLSGRTAHCSPGAGFNLVGLACVFFTVIANAAYHLLSRFLAGSERTLTMLFYSALVGTICFGLRCPGRFQESRPPPWICCSLSPSASWAGWVTSASPSPTVSVQPRSWPP